MKLRELLKRLEKGQLGKEGWREAMKRSNQIKLFGYQLHVDPAWEDELGGCDIDNTGTDWSATIVDNESTEEVEI